MSSCPPPQAAGDRMDVTKHNFPAVAAELEALLEKCDFVAFDEEMTGVPFLLWTPGFERSKEGGPEVTGFFFFIEYRPLRTEPFVQNMVLIRKCIAETGVCWHMGVKDTVCSAQGGG